MRRRESDRVRVRSGVSKTLRDPVAVCVGGCSFSKTKSWQDAPAPALPASSRVGTRLGRVGSDLARVGGGRPCARPPAARPRRRRAGIVLDIVRVA